MLLLLLLFICLPRYSIPKEWTKITLCNTEKYKNQAGMNLTPPPPSQHSYAVRWHCTAESEQRAAEIKSWFLCRRPTDQQACDQVSKGRHDPTHWLDPMTQWELLLLNATAANTAKKTNTTWSTQITYFSVWSRSSLTERRLTTHVFHVYLWQKYN